MRYKCGSPAPWGGDRASKSVLAGNQNHSDKNKRPRAKAQQRKRPRIDFQAIAKTALPHLASLVPKLVPGGRIMGGRYHALNPRRADKTLGNFSINLRTGQWGDFAIGETGGDFISLYAYVKGVSQKEAALAVARMIGMEPNNG